LYPLFAHQQLLKIVRQDRLSRLIDDPGIAIITQQGIFRAWMGGEQKAMKTFTIAAVILAVLAAPAHAQARRPQGDDKKKTDQRPAVDEKAYKAALERIPDSKEKYDPWSITKPADPAKKPK